jgi:hypothetical protein
MILQPDSGRAPTVTEFNQTLPARSAWPSPPSDAVPVEVPAGTFRCGRTTSRSGDIETEVYTAVGLPTMVRQATRSPQMTMTQELIRIEVADGGLAGLAGAVAGAVAGDAASAPEPAGGRASPLPPSTSGPGPAAAAPCGYCGQPAERGAVTCSQCGAELR